MPELIDLGVDGIAAAGVAGGLTDLMVPEL